jgi:glycosyltransferase involved in cell wall biosynthesis
VKILSITAGAAGMYCGSCARDNALAAELMARGHDVTLIPVYTPTRTDEPNVSRPKVLFGGISVYLQQYSKLFRWTPQFLDRFWDAPGVIGAFAGRMVSNDPRMLGDLTISMLQGESGVLKKEFDKLISWIRAEPLPDVINLPNSLLIALAQPLRRAVGRPVCCTLQGEELFLEGLTSPYRDRALEAIRAKIPHVDRFIAVSEYCAQFMSRYLRIPRDKISVVPLGINLNGYEQRPPPTAGDPFRIGYFARIAPEKGLHVLAEAYIRFRKTVNEGTCRLEAAGYTSPDHVSYMDGVKQTLAKAGLAEEFTYHGVVDREGKLAFLKRLNLLSVPATYDEPKGLFLLEALGCGVPVIQPRRGGFIEIVEKTSGGVLVEPDNVGALAAAFVEAWMNPADTALLGERGFAAVRKHYSVQESAAKLVAAFESLTVAARAL